MKQMILFVICMSQVLFSGCGEEEVQEGGPFGIVEDVVAECCGKTYLVSAVIDETQGGRFFYLGLIDADYLSLAVQGEPVFVPDGVYSEISLSLTVSYFDNLYPGTYYLRIFGTDYFEDVGVLAKSAVAGYLDTIQVSSYTDSVCLDCCTSGRKYVRFQKRVQDIIGINADILIRYGVLCGIQGISEDAPFGKVFTSVNKIDIQTSYGVSWAQIGYGYERFAGSSTTYDYVYAEISDGDEVNQAFVFNSVPEYFSYVFQCSLNTNTGRWSFKIDSDRVFDDDTALQILSYWRGSHGTHAYWAGEILNREDDMAGTVSQRCVISDCQYDTGMGFRPTQVDNYDKVVSDNPAEWGIDRPDSDVVRI